MSRSLRLLLIFAAASVLGLLYFFYSPYEEARFPGCALHSLTGLYCPACGSQRAFADLLHGHVLTACRNNLLFVIALLLFTAWYLLEIRKVVAGTHWRRVRWPRSTPWLLLAVVMVFFLLRNLPFFPFQELAPAQ